MTVGFYFLNGFFKWAAGKAGWESLKNIPGLPISADVSISGVSAQGVGGDVNINSIPESKDQLVTDLKASQIEAQDSQRRVRELEAAYEKLRQKNETQENKKKQASEYGKQGGRGNQK